MRVDARFRVLLLMGWRADDWWAMWCDPCWCVLTRVNPCWPVLMRFDVLMRVDAFW